MKKPNLLRYYLLKNDALLKQRITKYVREAKKNSSSNLRQGGAETRIHDYEQMFKGDNLVNFLIYILR